VIEADLAPQTKKLVLVVVDSLKREMLARSIADGKAPLFGEIVRRGTSVSECVSVFPSVTPAASASITTGARVAEHGVPSINWYHRGESRYVEYGSSWPATRTFGVLRTLKDIVYNMNFEHLSRSTPTVFESLDDAGVRTACTPFLIFRGRTRHELAVQGWMRRVAQAANFHHAVYGPAELFYGELYSSRSVDCRPTLARPGTRDAYSGCVGEHLARYDLFDFLLFSLPDNDHYSHRNGPDATVTSIEWADRNLQRVADGAGGTDAFLEQNAVILMADHSQSDVHHGLRLMDALSDWDVLRPNDPAPHERELAVSPGGRSAMLYLLGDDGPRAARVQRLVRRLDEIEGVELAAWRRDGEACVRTAGGELRFTPGSSAVDARGWRWEIEGSPSVLEGRLDGDLFSSGTYPDVLGRIWSALEARGGGDVLLSAAPGYEFTDWGGADHVGGGSHGSLRVEDSIVPLVFWGCGPDLGDSGDGGDSDGGARQWSIVDVAPVVRKHFGVAAQRDGQAGSDH
jgi:predicted AlkP superfamily pyrophosphatase or phosphodiesterase